MAKVTEEIDLKLNDTSVDSELSKVANSAKKADESISHLQGNLDKLGKSAESTRVDEFNKKWDEVHTTSEELAASLESLQERLKNATNPNDLRQLGVEMDALRAKTTEYANSLKSINITSPEGSYMINPDKVTSQLNEMAKTAGDQMSSILTKKLKAGFSQVTSIIRKSITSTLNFAKTAVSKYFGVLKSGFTSLFNFVKKQFSSVASYGKNAFGGLGSLLGQLKSLIGVIGLGYLAKNMYELSSSAINLEGTMKNVFGEMTDDIRDWSDEFASRFTLTSMQARSFATEFGTALGNLGLDDKAKTEMSKNLTALSGDIASFYGKSAEESAKLVKGAVTGQTRSLKQLGIVLNDATLNQYALAQGYAQTYTNMSETDKAIVRYNYLLSQTVGLQGTASNSEGTWTDQIRMLKANFQQLGAILGGLLIKVLYPIVTVLNQIIVSAINAMNILGKIMGFDPVSLSELTGAGAGAIDDTTDALEDEADAIDGVGKASKKAGENLQGFDKLNNITTQSSSGSGKTAGAGIGGGIDFDSYYENIADGNKANKITKFFDELWKLLGEKNWEGVGTHLAKGLNEVNDSIYKLLKNEKNYNKIKKLADNISYFFKGLLNIDTSKIGANIGAGVNLITFAINELYNSLTAEDILTGIGSKIENFFEGLSSEIDFNRLGMSMTTGMRTMMDIARGFFDSAEANDLSGQLSNNIKDFIGGAIERLLGNGGAEEIGQNIASILNFAFDLLSGLFDPANAAKVGDAVVTLLNTAITDLDESKLQSAASNILSTIGNIFRRISNIDTDELSDKISGAINGAVDEGSLSNAASGLASGFLKLFELLGETIKKIKLTSITGSILIGVGDAIKNNQEGAKYLGEALGIVLGGTLVINATGLGIKILGKALMEKLATYLAGSAASSSIGGAVGTAAGSGTAASAASAGASSLGASLGWALIYAIAAYIGFRLGNVIGDAIVDSIAKINTNKINNAIEGINIDDNVKVTESNVEQLRKVTNQYEAMCDAIAEYNETWGDVSTTDLNLIDDVAAYEQMFELQVKLVGTMRQMKETGVEIEGLDEAIQKLSRNYATASGRSTAIMEAMALLGDGFIDVKAAVEEFDTSLENSQTTVKESSQVILNDLLTTLDATDELPQIGTNNSTSYIEGITDTFNADTSVESSLTNLLSSAEEEGKVTSEAAGTNIGTTLAGSTVNVIDANTSVQTSYSDLISRASNEANGVATVQAKQVGENITAGIEEGINSPEKNTSIFNTIGNFCSNLINTFKTNLGIHSPSKVFRELTAFIPEGAALGIEDGEADALDAIEKFSDNLISKFDSKSINIREMLNLDGIDEVMSTARNKVKTSLQGLQSDVFVQPNFRRFELDAITAQGSTNAVLEQKLTNMASRMNMNNSNRQMTVSVYLDASNKLGDFIIDTVNGQVVRGGAF